MEENTRVPACNNRETIMSTILVIDDEKHVRMLYEAELSTEGYTIISSDGQEPVLELIERTKPDAVVLDIKLGPNLSGLDLLQTIRTVHQDLPVVLSTAYSSFKTDFKAIVADYYVVKSVDLTDLKNALSLALQKSRQPHSS